MLPPQVIDTERLRLRSAFESDAEAIFAAYGQDHDVTMYLAWRPSGKLEDTREHLRLTAKARDEGKALQWVILRKDDEALLGMIGGRIDGHKVELGYVLAKAYWNKGYMTEAVRAVIDWALREPDIFRVWAVCDIENPASARVMEKVGMKREGVLRRWSIHPTRSADPRDCYSYAITK
ncbi:MAG TPA: GNAT family N-acetyltransferase [Verrucomicrobiae bacterium]|jgi:[ribosomal protein S5]-alanine N-acetyltransferase|nr:GNAT family N-acetyltransferase [Verrucomicrobiae bacterium]